MYKKSANDKSWVCELFTKFFQVRASVASTFNFAIFLFNAEPNTNNKIKQIMIMAI